MNGTPDSGTESILPPQGLGVQPDCWNKSGVFGDRTCAELQTAVHCRNCPIYSKAGLQILSRAIPADYRREWTERFARHGDRAPQANGSAVVFRIESSWLALPTHIFQEVAEHRPIHSLPHNRSGTTVGLANVRGELLICINLCPLVGCSSASSAAQLRTGYRRLLVLNSGGDRFAVPVHEVHGICRFHLQDLKAPPATLSRSQRSYTAGFLAAGGHSALFLKADPIFAELRRSLLER